MTKLYTNFAGLKPGAKLSIVALALVIIFGMPDGYVNEIPGMVSAAAQHALVLLPSFVLTAAQTLHGGGHGHFSVYAVEMLVVWPVLQTAVRTA